MPELQANVLNLGSGRARMPGAINVDISQSCQPDVVHDLRVFPWPFDDNTFDRIYCYDVLEHLPDTIATMQELHRIARPSAIIAITTPHFTCFNAFTDPTHCHFFGLFSFDFFTGESTHDFYTDVRFAYRKRQLIFDPTRKNTLIRRVANRWPEFYERHLGWLFPAWFMSIELEVLN